MNWLKPAINIQSVSDSESDFNHISPYRGSNSLDELSLDATIVDLPLYQASVSNTATGNEVAEILKKRIDLPGVLIYKEGQLIGLLSRRFFLEKVGRYYGVEVYMNRPVEVMLKRIQSTPLILEVDCPVQEAATRALNRLEMEVYEPLVVKIDENAARILDIHTLLLAQSKLLDLSNCKVNQQIEASEVIQAAGAEVASILEVKQILKKVPEHLSQLLDFHRLSIFRHEGKVAVLEQTWGYDENLKINTRFPIDELFQEIVDTKHWLNIPEIDQEPRFQCWNQSHHTGSWLALPIIQSSKVIGFLTLDNYASSYFDPEKANLVQLYLNQISAAIQNARMYQDIRRYAQEMEFLHTSARTLVSSLHPDEIYQQMLETILEIIPECTTALILETDQEESVMGVAAALGSQHLETEEIVELGLDQEIIQAQREGRMIQVICDEEDSSQKNNRSPRFLVLPLQSGNRSLGILLIGTGQDVKIREQELHLVSILTDTATAALRNSQLHQEVQNLAATDVLTGLANRRGFYSIALREVKVAKRHKRPLSVIMVDIDDFKDVNDSFGHLVGDQVIQWTAKMIKENIRSIDVCCRYGGEEYTILLPESCLEDSYEVAERIRTRISQSQIQIERETINISISSGVAEINHLEKESTGALELMLSEADRALYQSKNTGKDRVSKYERKNGQTTPLINIKDLSGNQVIYPLKIQGNESELQIIGASRREIEGHLSSILKHASEAIISTNRNDQIIILNQSAVKMFHCQSSFAKGQNIQHFIPGYYQDCFYTVDESSQGSKKQKTIERGSCLGRRYDGSVFPIELSRSSFLINQEKITTVIISDITDRKQAEKKIRQSNIELAQAYDLTIAGWARALELRDLETHGHSARVVDTVLQLAEYFLVDCEQMKHIQRGALLHDIGKIAIPDCILLKPGSLNQDEWSVMHQHPLIARDLLDPIDFLKPALPIPLYHHEKYDGSGYPFGLKGQEIPLQARLFAVVDVWDALRTDRPYRKAWREDRIIAYLKAESGKHFDPAVVEAFFKLFYPKS